VGAGLSAVRVGGLTGSARRMCRRRPPRPLSCCPARPI